MTRIILPEYYKPLETEEYMSPMQLEYFRQKLLRWREEILTKSYDSLEYLMAENWNERDPNDQSIVEVNTSFEIRTRGRYCQLIEKIDKALMRIDGGEYGYCEETGEEIGIKRLEARPIATLCIEAQESYENYQKQHLDFDEDQTED